MELTPNEVYQGDCIKLLRNLKSGSVDLVFADPPFNIGYQYDVYDDKQGQREYLDWSRSWISAVYSCLSASGTFWLAIGDEYAAELKLIAQDAGFTCRSWVVWYYTFGVNCARGFSRSHTHLFHFVKDTTKFTFHGDNPAVRVLSARQLVYADGRANPKGRLPDNTWIYRPQDAPYAFSADHDTWYFSRVAGTFHERQGFHGCQMPEQLLGRIVRVSSSPHDLVLDPFSGSGTTLAVAKKLGRQWLGFELSEQYVKRIKERLLAVKAGEELDGPSDPRRSAPATRQGKRIIRFRNGQPIPQCDEKTLRGFLQAYKSAGDGYSVDYLLCDPDRNLAFVNACKHLGLAGSPFFWNRLLLRLRKSGKLPRVTKAVRRFTFEGMDSYSFASEIAMRLLELDYGRTIDDVLCSPEHAAEFDRLAADFSGNRELTSFEYRWAALAIRKRAVKSKTLAEDRFREWARKHLPRPKDLHDYSPADLQGPGVYVFSGRGQKLYVGESRCVWQRLELARDSPCWGRLGLDSMIHLPGDYHQRHGLQSALISRFHPLLNTQLLVAGVREGTSNHSIGEMLDAART